MFKSGRMRSCSVLCLLPLVALFYSSVVKCQPASSWTATADLSTHWTLNKSSDHAMWFTDGSFVLPFLRRQIYGWGFYGNETAFPGNYFLAVFILPCSYNYTAIPHNGCSPAVVWSANRNYPVKINSTVELTSEGDLVLKDADGRSPWSTNTSGRSALGLNLTEFGSLKLFNSNGNYDTVWESHDYPTDTLLLRQKWRPDRKLTAMVSSRNWTEFGLVSFSLTRSGLYGRMETDPPQYYYQYDFSNLVAANMDVYMRYLNGSLSLFLNFRWNRLLINIPPTTSLQYMKLGSDGHLRAYHWNSSSNAWEQAADLLTASIGGCGYPMACGKYGICSKNGKCSCPALGDATNYFRQNDRDPTLGCSEVIPLSCEASESHSFLELYNVTYFDRRTDLTNIMPETCREACLKNCSCKAALFRSSTPSICSLQFEIFSLMDKDMAKIESGTIAYIKVQGPHNGRKGNRLPLVVGTGLGASIFLIGVIIFCIWKRKYVPDLEEDYLDQVPAMSIRFSYEDLKSATDNFRRKLGEGGFGSVYEGTLINGAKVAVKRLVVLGHIKKSFLAEVETIGNIHHVNLVRLVGFCIERTHRLLVYEYMSNGSLDKWIFHKEGLLSLGWQRRKKIILDIAKGLHYLHEECRQKIIHLDIKPQNILLDENFNAKVSDFGLSKLIDRDQSQVVTTMRGTLGYLAPEWLSAVITKKVDVYSFGVVILEIVCGRKVFDSSLPEEDSYLLSVLKRKVGEDRLIEMVDELLDDRRLNGDEAVRVVKLAAWCLQADCTKRPSMSMVLKVLDGTMEVEEDLDYDFWVRPTKAARGEIEVSVNSSVMPSIISGPR